MGWEMCHSCGEKLSPPGPLHYLLQELGICAVNKMEQEEVSWDGLLNTALENLIFFLMCRNSMGI